MIVQRKRRITLIAAGGLLLAIAGAVLFTWEPWVDRTPFVARTYVAAGTAHFTDEGDGVCRPKESAVLLDRVRLELPRLAPADQVQGVRGVRPRCARGREERRLYLPMSWTDDRERCRRAGIDDAVGFETKVAMVKAMVRKGIAEEILSVG